MRCLGDQCGNGVFADDTTPRFQTSVEHLIAGSVRSVKRAIHRTHGARHATCGSAPRAQTSVERWRSLVPVEAETGRIHTGTAHAH